MARTWILCVFCGVWLAFGNAEETVFVTTPQGSMMGLKKITVLNNKTYYSFKGIPFSKPMVGEHKFDPPEDPEPWEGLLDARNHREPCTQFNTLFDFLEGEEDCLHLNIYTPSIYRDTCKPVMVWIYGGGFNLGQANYDYYGGDYLVEHDVVVVTFNYRLGAMGFLCTGDKHAPGNVGLKDQTYALRWVNKYIQYFGGCVDKVTIFGQDTGAVSAQYHMLSPMSRGLFHAVIAQSGSVTDYWGLNYLPKERAHKVGRQLGIDTSDSKKLVDELKKLPSKDIALATSKFYYTSAGIPNLDFMFMPCIEAKVEGQERFLPGHPMDLIMAGDIADVPMITGVLLNEGAFAFTEALNLSPLIQKVNLTIREKFVVRPTLGLTEPDKISRLYNEARQFYFGDTPVQNVTLEQMQDLISDVLYVVQNHITSKIINEQIESEVYRYVFTYASDDAQSRPFINAGNVSTHSDDLEYIFFFDAFAMIPEPGTNAYKMNQLMCKMWTNFAKTGNPTPVMENNLNFKWQPTDKGKRTDNLLYIDLQPEMKHTYFVERMNFWMPRIKHLFGKFVNIFI